MSALRLCLLGGFEARYETGEKLSLPTRKAEALLAHLALARGKGRSRDQLAALLWSDRAEPQAKTSLRQALTSLRRVMKPNDAAFLATEGETVSLRGGALSVDVLEFEELAAKGSNACLARASQLYQGDLLDGLRVRDPAFNEWVAHERARLRGLAVDVVDRELARLLREGDHSAAISVAQRLLALEPLRESTYRTLMRLYFNQDQRGLAARQFEQCRKILADELGIDPAPATQRLYDEVVRSGPSRRTCDMAGRRSLDPLPLPANPSVAVLPFMNLSGDPDQSYLCDGLTEDMIADLSRFESLFVIGPESSLALKEREIGLDAVARTLGVEYVVEGSLRRAGDVLRVTVQLIDPSTGHRLWAERFNRPFADVFEIQDAIVGNIAGALSVNIEHVRAERLRQKPEETLDAYDFCLRAKHGMMTCSTEGYDEAKRLFHRAAELDPGFAPAWAGLALAHLDDVFVAPGGDPEASFANARTYAEKALALDRTLGGAHVALAYAHLQLGNVGLARDLVEQSAVLAPNDAQVLALRAAVLLYLGEFGATMKIAERGRRINPFSPDCYLDTQGGACFLASRFEEAARLWARIGNPTPDCLGWQAANLALMGDEGAACEKATEFVREIGAIWCGSPSAGPADFAHWITNFSNPFAREQDRDRLMEGLRCAGLIP